MDTQMKQFVVLVLGLSIPFYVLGALASDGDVVALPVSALAVVVPLTAAVIVTRRGGDSVRELLVDGVRPAPANNLLWMVIGLGTMPAVLIAAHALAYARNPAASGMSLPVTAALMLVFLVGAYGEEMGWTAFLARRLLDRRSVLVTGLLVGGLWAVWHVIPFAQTNNSWRWVAWQLVFIVALRVLLTALYAASGRTALVAILIHGSFNMAWTLLPIYWSPYDPVVLVPLTVVAAFVALVAQRGLAQAAVVSGPDPLVGATQGVSDVR